MSKAKLSPDCSKKDCFANNGRTCWVLTSNDFNGRECPFYKTKDQLDTERHATSMRLYGGRK